MTIVDLLEGLQCPLINGLYFENGDIVALDYRREAEARIVSVGRLRFRDIDLEAVGVVEFDYLGRRVFGDHEIRYGEGSAGGDGVACLLSRESNRVLWFLFLDNSNPFCEARIAEDTVLLTSTDGAVFSVPHARPEAIGVARAADFR